MPADCVTLTLRTLCGGVVGGLEPSHYYGGNPSCNLRSTPPGCPDWHSPCQTPSTVVLQRLAPFSPPWFQLLPSPSAPFRLLSQDRPIRRYRWIVDRLSRFILAGYHSSSVQSYDEAETIVLQHDFMHLSFYKDDFQEFVDTLVVVVVYVLYDSLT